MEERAMQKGFQNIGDLLPFKVAYEVVRRFPCEICGSERIEAKGVEVFGPKKGQPFHREEPCQRCEELQLFKQQQEAAKLEAKKRKSAKALAHFEEKSTINTKLINASFLNYMTDNPILANARERALLWVSEYNAENPRNLAFIGSYGTGKSHLAVSVGKALMDLGHTCIFITVQKLMTLIKQSYDRGSQTREGDLLTALESVDILILDDIGAEGLSQDWGQPKLFEIIDARQGKATIYTSNDSREELIPKLNGRNVSRMFFETDIIPMHGPDYRG